MIISCVQFYKTEGDFFEIYKKCKFKVKKTRKKREIKITRKIKVIYKVRQTFSDVDKHTYNSKKEKKKQKHKKCI